MLTMPLKEWTRYRDVLKAMSDAAANEFRDAVFSAGGILSGGTGMLSRADRNAIIEYAYALVQKYSAGSSAAACEWYDALAALSGARVEPAEPADPPDIGDVAKGVNGTLPTGNPDIIGGAIGRMVKQAGQDTTLQNAMRDSAQVMWVTSGDTCAYCTSLSAMGWVNASEEMMKDKHAKHIHANCDCFYTVQFDEGMELEGFSPEENYKTVYEAAVKAGVIEPGDRLQGNQLLNKNILNATRREYYEENDEEINAQKRSAYAKKKEREAPKAEEKTV